MVHDCNEGIGLIIFGGFFLTIKLFILIENGRKSIIKKQGLKQIK